MIHHKFGSRHLSNADEIRTFLQKLKYGTLQDLIMAAELVQSELRPADKLRFNIPQYCTHYQDRAGRLSFIENVLRSGLVKLSQIPFLYRHQDGQKQGERRYDFFRLPEKELDIDSRPALTDELVAAPQPLRVTNPRWEHVDEEKKKSRSDAALSGDTICLMADIGGFPEGALMSFEIFDITISPPMRIDTVSGTHRGGVGKGQWTVKEPQNSGESSPFEFEAVVRSKPSPRCAIAVATCFSILLEIDIDDPKAKDDELILLDANGGEVMKLKVGCMSEVMPDTVRLQFPGVDMDKKYTLIRDYGKDEDGGTDELFSDMSPNEILGIFA